MPNGDREPQAKEPTFINGLLTYTGRVYFPHLASPDEGKRYSDGKYKLTLVVPKEGADMAALKKGVLECAVQAHGPEFNKLATIVHPFRDGDELDAKGKPKHPGCWFIIPKTKKTKPPVLVDISKGRLEGEDIYPGCYARCIVTAMSYVNTEKVKDSATGKIVNSEAKGVTFLLEKVQKMKDGERMAGARVEAEFPDEAASEEKPEDVL
jgi:hypothetical protein